MPDLLSMVANNVNSYRRLIAGSDAPINVHWGRDNRTTGFRVPVSPPESRRVENRVAGADANPYLAIASSLAAGYIGMVDGIAGEYIKLMKDEAGQHRFLPRKLVTSLEG